MNVRKINRQRVLRHRRLGTIPTLLWVLPNGSQVEVRRSKFQAQRASYRVAHAEVYGTWPPAPSVMREIKRWS